MSIRARSLSFLLVGVGFFGSALKVGAQARPVIRGGEMVHYELAESVAAATVVTQFSIALEPRRSSEEPIWFRLSATKRNGRRFTVWLFGQGSPEADVDAARAATKRYLIQRGDGPPVEYRDRRSGNAVLPVLGGWEFLFPRGSGNGVRYLGHRYQVRSTDPLREDLSPPNPRVIRLRTDAFIGFPHNTRQREDQRRFDRSDYQYVELSETDYRNMLKAGINCVNVNATQLPWVEWAETYFWGAGGGALPFPECLYQSNYLGPSIFLDEPMVGTRDHVLRPRLQSDPEYRVSITPQNAFGEFVDHFTHSREQGAPSRLLSALAARPGVALGDMRFEQEHVYSWETMVSSASYQLRAGGKGPPQAIVFEPPGRFGTRRTLPEMNMTYGCQIPADDPKNLASIIYGFLRGAARMTGKEWGMSIYGAVDRADTFWFQTHAYDLGATHFYFWDTYQLACVPYEECLALSRNLSAHAASHPDRDLARLRRAAEIAIVLPVGYNLGHVQMGKGSLWGIGELNLERRNRKGVRYREIMRNVFIEIERCLRLGLAFDLFWDLEGLTLSSSYREVVRVLESGTVEVQSDGGTLVLQQGARMPVRPQGPAPELKVTLEPGSSDNRSWVARAQIREYHAPVFYTLGADEKGRYQNVYAAWELYGPQEEDYRFLREEGDREPLRVEGNRIDLEIGFRVGEPGNYRLRIATADLVGRSRVVWKEFRVED